MSHVYEAPHDPLLFSGQILLVDVAKRSSGVITLLLRFLRQFSGQTAFLTVEILLHESYMRETFTQMAVK